MTFYALWAPYGVRTVYNEHHRPMVYSFERKKDRDTWVNNDPNSFYQTREACSYKTAMKYK